MQVVVCLCVQITSGTPLKHSTSLSAMFVYIPFPPNNPINARAPSLGPRLSFFSEVSYWVNYNPLQPSNLFGRRSVQSHSLTGLPAGSAFRPPTPPPSPTSPSFAAYLCQGSRKFVKDKSSSFLY